LVKLLNVFGINSLNLTGIGGFQDYQDDYRNSLVLVVHGCIVKLPVIGHPQLCGHLQFFGHPQVFSRHVGHPGSS
jgi:hypothetical protein